MLRRLTFSTLGLALAVAAGSAAAQQVEVLATVSNNCTVSTTTSPVNFGAYAGAALTAEGNISVTCTTGSTAVIGLDSGGNASGTQRRMAATTGTPAAFLNYALFQPSGVGTTATCPSTGGTEWTNSGTGLFSAGAAPSNAARTIKVCGRLPAGQDVRAASYRDLVTVSISF